MRSKATLILAAVALSAVLFYYLVEQPRHAREAGRIAGEDRFTSIRADDVHSVSIDRPDAAISAVRKDGRWRITSPVDDAADDTAFNVLVLTTCGARVGGRFDAEDSDLSEYGLSTPSATVRFATGEGERLLELQIGDLNPSKSHCYALLPNAPDVLLLPAGVRRYAVRPLFEYRDKRIVDIEVQDVGRIDLMSSTHAMSWSADGDGGWFTVQGGDTVRGNPAAVEGVIRRLRGLRARNILFGESRRPDANEANPLGTIRLSTRSDSARISVVFDGLGGDSCYVTTPHNGRTAVVDTTISPLFSMSVDDFRDKRLLAFDADALAKIAWNTPERELSVFKRDGAWAYANPGFGKVSPGAARRLISTISSLECTAVLERRVTDPAGHGFDAPVLRLTLIDAADRWVDEVIVGSLLPDGSSRYVWSRSTRALSSIDPASVAGLEDDLSGLAGP